MAFTLRPFVPGDPDLVRRLLAHPSLGGEFETLRPPGVVEDALSDPYGEIALARIAEWGGEPVGFSMGFVLPTREGAWSMLRIGVPGPHRRRGVGTALLNACLDHLGTLRDTRGLNEVAMSAWVPSDCAAGFAAHHGFRHTRYFWRMDRPRALAVPAPEWPAGIVTRVFDDSDGMVADWTDAYNDSFAAHYHSAVGNNASTRARTRGNHFRRDGLLLAYRDGVCVGFCQNVLHDRRGEIALLGVIRAARGIGLGRALLRWGAGWLGALDLDTTELMVDGENESALGLYRAEGFTVAATREIWGRPPRPR